MSHKFEIKDKSIRLDDVDISETVMAWSYSFSQNNLASSRGQTPLALVLTRIMYDGKEPMSDDSGLCVYNQVLYDVEVSIQIDGRKSKIVIPKIPVKVK